MKEKIISAKFNRIGRMRSAAVAFSAMALCICAVAEENAEEPIVSPHAKGGEVSIFETASYKRYIHVFTNTAEVAQFRNKSRQPLRGRILVVGAGGAGGFGLNTASGGGGGGGGGGVWERKGFNIPSGACWNVLVGKGSRATTSTSSIKNDTAGSSSISNGTECIALVPGGGNGGESTASDSMGNGHAATAGAAGGGGIRPAADGAEGTYVSSIDGVFYGPFPGADRPNLYRGGGGGGAGAAGSGANGGEGLASDITGVSLVYGSGGGGGGSITEGLVSYSSGTGGTRAGDGASATVANASTNVIAPTVPVANSGCGGAGGLGGYVSFKGSARWGSPGANGIVIIAYEFYKIPFVGGEMTKIAERGDTSTYIHVFTNVNEVATFENITGEDIPVRTLVVGAGGAGGFGLNSASGGGGGGGGGGVLDVANVTMPADGVWNVLVGKGSRASTSTSSPKNDTMGSSSISNGTECIALVPGGGNGGESTSSGAIENGHKATAGAAGGGGIRADTAGAEGTYSSSILGVVYGPFPGADRPNLYRGGGGGGAGAEGTGANGGEGLTSDITGISLVYGSGGGGGGSLNTSSLYSGGTGGTRAGDGAFATVVGASTNVTAATVPVANSGGGGAGGLGGTYTSLKGNARWGSSGANGIVVIRYDWTYNPNPPVFGFKVIIR